MTLMSSLLLLVACLFPVTKAAETTWWSVGLATLVPTVRSSILTPFAVSVYVLFNVEFVFCLSLREYVL